MSAETVPAENTEPEDMAEAQAPIEANESQTAPQEPPKEEQVPLSALQKERRRRQETEQELRWYRENQMRQQQAQMAQQPDESEQEPVSKKELVRAQKQAVQEALETQWIADNPEKAAEINDKLQDFLKTRPHLARAIEDAPNRYKEAWTLMDALSPKQKSIGIRPPPLPKKDAPGNPAAVPKAHGINQSVDYFAMTDAEYNAWRQSQRKRR